MDPRDSGTTLVLYDGVCGFCSASIQFLLRRDPAGQFRFAALQSQLAQDLLARHGVKAADLDTVYVIDGYGSPEAGEQELDVPPGLRPGPRSRPLAPASPRGAGSPGERVLSRSTAALHLAGKLGFPWSLARAAMILPAFVRDAAYDLFAKHRYKIFGKLDACMIPDPAVRERFLG